MISALDMWRRRPWVWWVPLAFVGLNLLLLAFYRSSFAGGVARLESSYEGAAEDLERLSQERQKVEGLLQQIDDQKSASRQLYLDYFSTEAQRFTRALREIRTLARRAGLDPSSFSYPSSEVDAQAVVRRGINFSVRGTYDQLRSFMNLLELTEQFLSLESVSLGGGQADRDPNLSIRLSLSTIFALPEGFEAEAARAALRAEGRSQTQGLDGDGGSGAEGETDGEEAEPGDGPAAGEGGEAT